MIPINYWQSTEGEYSERSWDKPLYSSEQNTAPESCDYFTIRKEFEDKEGTKHQVTQDQATVIANYLEFKGEVRESQTGQSWRVYKKQISNSFDLSAIPA
tara:strand:+ start:449 stop:748 length:300 start_codon:yes stop_codon:yes gene_type:complete